MFDENGYQKFLERYGINELYSYEWSRGGNRCDCWGGDYEIEPDEEPELTLQYFHQFDHLLENIYPGMEQDFKEELLRETVTIDYDLGESDWYGGREAKAAFRCDLRELYTILDEKGIITAGILLKG